MNPILGIQILSYNKPDYLKRTLDSLYENINNFNLKNNYFIKIVVLDQSDEENQKTIKNIIKEYNDITFLPLKENLGQRGATNLIFTSSFWDDCDYVMLSDHDNLFYTSIETYINLLDYYKDLYIVTGYHSPEHDIENIKELDDSFKNNTPNILLKSTCRAGHMVFRKDDFFKNLPCDLKSGNSDFNIGLDWWFTHWSPNSPNMSKSKQFLKEYIGCIPGGVIHIGTESTWNKGYYNEYSIEELNEFKSLNKNDLINNKYIPKHTHIKEKYWYENKPDYNNEDKINTSILCKDEIDFLLKNNKKLNSKKSNIIGFNYAWPEYGVVFLEDSIKNIIDHVEEYWLFLNKYSYIGTECDDSKLDKIIDICKKYKKVKVFINTNKEKTELEQQNNVAYYITLIYELCVKKDKHPDYLFLVQSDELYYKFDEILNKHSDYLFNESNEKNYIFQPITYFIDPLYKIDPVEIYNRPSLINFNLLKQNNGKIYKKDSIEYNEIEYLHMSYVLSYPELYIKFNNWGHRNNITTDEVDEWISEIFLKLENNKSIQNCYPIKKLSFIYKNIIFDNNLITLKYRLELYEKFWNNNFYSKPVYNHTLDIINNLKLLSF